MSKETERNITPRISYTVATADGNFGPLLGSHVFFIASENNVAAVEPVMAYDLHKMLSDPIAEKLFAKYRVSYHALPTEVLASLEEEGFDL